MFWRRSTVFFCLSYAAATLSNTIVQTKNSCLMGVLFYTPGFFYGCAQPCAGWVHHRTQMCHIWDDCSRAVACKQMPNNYVWSWHQLRMSQPEFFVTGFLSQLFSIETYASLTTVQTRRRTTSTLDAASHVLRNIWRRGGGVECGRRRSARAQEKRYSVI